MLKLATNAICSAVCEAGDVRLRGGIDSSNGRVEVCQFRTWGAVCSDGWDDNDARVVCGQLGYDPQGLYSHDCKSLAGFQYYYVHIMNKVGL